MPRLTKKLTEGTPIGNAYYIWDDQLPGFGLRVLPSGNKTFVVQYRYGKRIRKQIIGRYPLITAEDAREEAKDILNDVRKGKDPKAEQDILRDIGTVDDLAKRYLNEYCPAHQKPKTRLSSRSALNKHILPILGSRNVREVSRADIADIHLRLAKTPIAANHVLGVLSKMFNLAEEWEWRHEGTNPCRRIKKYVENKRERYLTYEEASALGSILQECKNYPDKNLPAIYCLQLLLLTGCRVGEILTLQWKFIDFDRRRIFLPDSKTGARTVYLGPSAISLLLEIKTAPMRPPDNPYVIWGKRPGCHLVELRGTWLEMRKLAKLKDVRIHDLRHSFASFAINQKISLATIGKLLGHTNVQTTARYAHLMEGTTTDAADLVTDQISALITIPKFKSNGQKTKQLLGKQMKLIPMTNVPMPHYFTSDQAADYLGLAPESMKDWRYRKAGPQYEKIGNRIRYCQTDLDAFRRRKTVTTS